MLSTLACTADPDGKSPRDTPAADHSSTDTLDGTTTPTGATAGTGHTGETEPTGPMPWELSTYDCTSLPATPIVVGDRLNWVPTAEDYTFSPDGFQWGVTGGILKKTPYGGPPQLVVPGLGDVRGTRFLPDGRLAMSHPEDGSVWIVDPATGSSAPIAGGLDTPNGLAIDFEGRISVATQERIVRIDPATGDTEVLVEWARKSFDGITYSPDFTRLYFNEELGRVHWIDFAPDGTWSEPDEGVQLVQNPLLGFSILDGMAVDVCGNLEPARAQVDARDLRAHLRDLQDLPDHPGQVHHDPRGVHRRRSSSSTSACCGTSRSSKRRLIILAFSLVGIAGSYGVAWFGIRINTFANSRTAFARSRASPSRPTPSR
jgi:hypothetical protein